MMVYPHLTKSSSVMKSGDACVMMYKPIESDVCILQHFINQNQGWKGKIILHFNYITKNKIKSVEKIGEIPEILKKNLQISFFLLTPHRSSVARPAPSSPAARPERRRGGWAWPGSFSSTEWNRRSRGQHLA